MNHRRIRQVGTLGVSALGLVVFVALCMPRVSPAADVPKAVDWIEFQRSVKPFLVKNCISCHGDNNPEGEVSLNQFTDAASLDKQSQSLTKALDMLRTHKMPPKTQPQPTADELKPVVNWLDTFAMRVALAGGKTPGHVTARRLNRSEYNNTIRDLLGIDYRPADAFPVDDAGYGFDNNGDVLSLAPMLMDKYLATAATVLERAILVEPVKPPPSKQWEAATMDGTIPKTDPKANSGGTGFGANMTNGRVFQSSGEIFADYVFPESGTYIFRVRGYGNTGTVNKQSPVVEFRVDGKVIGKPITIKNDQKGTLVYPMPGVRVEAGKHRVTLAFTNGPTAAEVAAAAAQPVAAPAANPPAAGAPARGAGTAGAAGGAGRGAGRGRGTGPQASPTGKPNLGVVFIEAEGPQEITMARIDRMPESYRKVFITLPSATITREQAARQILSNFATKAYRRPLRDGEIERLMAFWKQVNQPNAAFERSIALALQPILASPYFLYRIEPGPAKSDLDGARTLNEYELASRLSYFLWSSMPDDELFTLARQGRLRANLDKQVKRMIASPKSFALVEDFAGQWLQLRKMADVSPDAKTFPTFDDALRTAMTKETQLFFSAIMTEDRSVLEFIDSNFTFMNETLAKHYGRAGVKGDAFQRVTLLNDPRGGGLLTQASILTITSYPNRTSPVIRGKWVLENLLDAAPPPPPPDVPKLAEAETAQLTGTLRQRMVEHRSNPNCISCHAQMDPIGFGLENFDAIGKWRDKDNNAPIDASGELPDGTKFNGAVALKKMLLQQKDQFCACLVNRMLTYSLGRGVEITDLPTVKQITSGLKAQNYKFSALVTLIVQSDAFQKQGIKRGDP